MRRSRAPQRVWTSDYVDDFISESEEDDLLRVIRSLPFAQYSSRGVLLRRLMYEYGVSYPPTGAIVVADPIPEVMTWLVRRVEQHCDAHFDQLIITWYPDGAGIGPHVDHKKWFGETIAGVSLGAAGELTGRHPEFGEFDQRVLPRSLYVLRDAERYEWQHFIRPRRRDDRYSLTFRTLTEAARERIAGRLWPT